jgi:hypothetical protein
MEPARPVADEIVLDLLGTRKLQRQDVYETRQGTCRLGSALVREIADCSPRLRRPVGSAAEELARSLLGSRKLATPLTRRRHIEGAVGRVV